MGLQQAGGGPSERHLGVSPAFDVAGDLAQQLGVEPSAIGGILDDVGAGEVAARHLARQRLRSSCGRPRRMTVRISSSRTRRCWWLQATARSGLLARDAALSPHSVAAIMLQMAFAGPRLGVTAHWNAEMSASAATASPPCRFHGACVVLVPGLTERLLDARVRMPMFGAGAGTPR